MECAMQASQEEFRKAARQALIEILTDGPQLGAKLKPRLTAELGRRLNWSPSEWRTLIPRLSNFLAVHSDVVEVRRPVGPGDITVELRSTAQAGVGARAEASHSWYHPSVWAAFLNPD